MPSVLLVLVKSYWKERVPEACADINSGPSPCPHGPHLFSLRYKPVILFSDITLGHQAERGVTLCGRIRPSPEQQVPVAAGRLWHVSWQSQNAVATLQGRSLFPGDGSSFSELGPHFQPVSEDRQLGGRMKE